MGVEATCVKLGLSDGAGGVEGGTRCGSSGENDEGHPGSRASLNWRRWRDLGQRALDSIQGRRRGGGCLVRPRLWRGLGRGGSTSPPPRLRLASGAGSVCRKAGATCVSSGRAVNQGEKSVKESTDLSRSPTPLFSLLVHRRVLDGRDDRFSSPPLLEGDWLRCLLHVGLLLLSVLLLGFLVSRLPRILRRSWKQRS